MHHVTVHATHLADFLSVLTDGRSIRVRANMFDDQLFVFTLTRRQFKRLAGDQVIADIETRYEHAK